MRGKLLLTTLLITLAVMATVLPAGCAKVTPVFETDSSTDAAPSEQSASSQEDSSATTGTPLPVETENSIITYVGERAEYITAGVGVDVDATFSAHPGYEDDYPFFVINGIDHARRVWLTVASDNPNKIRDGYEALPEEYFSWITISQSDFYMEAGEVVFIPITISIPDDSALDGKNYQVVIMALDVSTEGIVFLGAKSIWYITIQD